MLNKHPIITQILDLIQQSSIELTICWVPSHSGIQGNEIADKLAKEAITIETITNISLPQNDIKAAFKTKVRNQWQTEWTNTNQNTNKLRNIKHKIGPFNSSFHNSRAWERSLARLRIGHTKLTHEYILKNENKPFCPDCLVELTVKHIIVECPSLQDERQIFTNQANNSPIEIKHILGETGPVNYQGKLYTFLRNTGFLNKI